MGDTTLRAALLAAALYCYEEYETLEDPISRAALSEDFLRRWLIVSDDPLALNPEAASGSYIFLFWKNLSVTNISIVELASLLRTHVRDRKENTRVPIDFISTEEYKTFLGNIWESLFSLETDEDEEILVAANMAADSERKKQFVIDRINRAVDQILSFHENFFQRTVIFDIYFTSVLIHVPLSLMVNIGTVAIESGYVHSAGLAIYVRNIEKAEKDPFVSRLGRYLDMHPGKRFFITPYASEFFAPFESKSSASVRNGLDGVRLQLKKHYFEDVSLLSFVAELKKLFPNHLSIPSGVKDYSEERANSRNEKANEEITIWFIADGGVAFDSIEKTANKNRHLYIIAYAQTHLNHNQLNIFKERKPAWIASTTLPHTLSAAMINIARHCWELTERQRVGRIEKLVIVDPFCGTGTTLLDSLARFSNATIIGLDQSQIMPALVRTNLEYFSSQPPQIARILSMLRTIRDRIKDEVAHPTTTDGMLSRMAKRDLHKSFSGEMTPENDFEYCLHLLMEEISIASEGQTTDISDLSVYKLAIRGFSSNVIELLSSSTHPLRLKVLFYLLWRALLMNTFSFRADARTPLGVFAVFIDELDKSIKQHQDFEKLLRDPIRAQGRAFCERIGSYSREGAIQSDFFGSNYAKPVILDPAQIEADSIALLNEGLHLCRADDSIKLLKNLKQTVDIVVTDPPYGFNAFESESEDMKSLYARMVPALIDTLRPWGQLIIALPAYAKNGKRIPFYQTRESVMKQIVAHVEANGRKIVSYVETSPASRDLFRLPWYWGTNSAIERRILHVVID